MTKKTRYSILAFGVLVFILLAPAIVLYVRGVDYNFSTNSFVKTGILSVRINPGDAGIYINGQLKRTGSGDIKFLLPGQYQVEIKKDGYQTWQKRLDIAAGKVTWASQGTNNLNLLFSEAEQKLLANQVLDFYSRGNELVYLTRDGLIVSSPQDLNNRKSYPLAKIFNNILAADQAGENFLLTNTATASPPTLLSVSLNKNTILDISGLFPSVSKMQFGDNGEIYALSGSNLYRIDPDSKNKTLLFSGVKAFYWQNGNLYLVEAKNQNYSLSVSPSPFTDSQTLLTGLPVFEQGELFVNFNKKIFLTADGSLYLLNSIAEPLADNITNLSSKQPDSPLTFVHAGELDYYNDLSNRLSFVTRSNQSLSNPIIRDDLGYAFFVKNNSFLAVELDTRDSQNQNTLYQGKNLQKFFLDSGGKTALLLDDGELKSLIIR